MKNKGFSLIELLMVVVILGILANFAIPMISDAKYKAQAAQVIADVNVIRVAAITHFADAGGYPRNTGWGSVPPDLIPSLPEGFSFQRGEVTYRWRYYKPGRSDGGMLQGILAGSDGMCALLVKSQEEKLLLGPGIFQPLLFRIGDGFLDFLFYPE